MPASGPVPQPSPEELAAHGAFVRAVARTLLRGEHDAEDVAQETALEAWRAPPRRPGGLRPWLRAVTRNLSIKSIRSRVRRDARERAVAPPTPAPSSADLALRAETVARLATAIARLPDEVRGAIVLRHYHGFPPAEVARCQDVPLETVRTRLRRGLERLRVELGVDDSRTSRRTALLALAAEPARDLSTTTTLAGALSMSVASKAAVGAAGVLAILAVAWIVRGSSESPQRSAIEASSPAASATTDSPTLAGRLDAGTEPAPSPARDGDDPTRPEGTASSPKVAAPSRVTLAGRAEIPAERLGEGWAVMVRDSSWRRALHVVAVRDDGTFAVEVPASDGPFQLFLRHRSALPPHRDARSATPHGAESGIVLAPDAVARLRVEIPGEPLPKEGAPVQVVRHVAGEEGTAFDVPAAATSFEVEGVQEGELLSILLGPLPDGRVAFVQGRPSGTTPLTLAWMQGSRLRGRVEPTDPPARKVEVFVESAMGFVLKPRIDAEGRFEQVGLMPNAHWYAWAEGRSAAGARLQSERVPLEPGDATATLRLAPVPR